jgi:thiamine biosynthesis protein ThiS
MSATIDTINLTVNGEPLSVPPGTLAALLAHLGLDQRKIAIELNREIVPRSTYAAVTLHPQDALEIVHFIGGG